MIKGITKEEMVEGFDIQDTEIRGLSDIYTPDKSVSDSDSDTAVSGYDIIDVLLDLDKLTSDQFKYLQSKRAANPNVDSETILINEKLVSKLDILMAKAKLYDLEFRRIEPQNIEKTVFEKLSPDFIKDNHIIPVAIEDNTLVVATTEPTNLFTIEDVKRQVKMPLKVVVCGEDDIDVTCKFFVEKESSETTEEYCVDDIISDMTEVEVIQEEQKDIDDLAKMAGESPVIKFVNYLISNAIRENASDIHIEPKNKFSRIRYRIDGVLFEIMQAPLKMHPAVVSRVKIMANLDISERRLPQDGKISVVIGGRAIDLRVSTLPTNRGEKVVIRVLDSKSILRGLEQLGMEPDVTETFRRQIDMPHGILLVTGPTGSGRDTTLYSALSQMDGEKLNVSTVEDPVEYELDFCNQVQTNDKTGLNFASALRSLLRQDPDIIMIGEIRDNETAKIAVQAALTGHLVLSTLHTNDAPSSVTRLVNIGVDAYLIAASLNAVLAQRLVRKICPKCKEPHKVSDKMTEYLAKHGVNTNELFHGAGCEACRGSGYSGRMGIYELLVVDDNFRNIINTDVSVSNMRRAFRESGQASLFDDGLKKLKSGLTTIEEIIRVTEMTDNS